MTELDDLVASNDPARLYLNGGYDVVAEMAVSARRARPSWWRTPQFAVPAAIGAVLLTTAAAVIVPLTMTINGQAVDAEVLIPITYTTETNVTVSCDYGIYVGDPATRGPADQRLADYLNARDWTGIGQEIYNRAMQEPFVPGPDDHFETDTQEIRDVFSFNRATGIIFDSIPADMWTPGMSAAASSTCTGQLR